MMDLMLDLPLVPVTPGISYGQKIMLLGSCFTEFIGELLQALKFSTCQNPHGIIFEPLSIQRSLNRCIEKKQYTDSNLVSHNGIWYSWEHHSAYSSLDSGEVLGRINKSIHSASSFLQEADWLIVTLGSSYVYSLVANGEYVANCHKVPAAWFNKNLLGIETSQAALTEAFKSLRVFNPSIRIILTVSPVRHIKDGIPENNRSKARLLEATHEVVATVPDVYYFPAYELVIDVLRDYRFFKDDMVHPTNQAVEFVFEKFRQVYFDKATQDVSNAVNKILQAKNHKPFHIRSEAHRSFLTAQIENAERLCAANPSLDLDEEINFFRKNLSQS